MAFIKRLMDHLLNQVLVETLANSRWFQRFAVYTHKLSKDAAEKSKRFVKRVYRSVCRIESRGVARVPWLMLLLLPLLL